MRHAIIFPTLLAMNFDGEARHPDRLLSLCSPHTALSHAWSNRAE